MKNKLVLKNYIEYCGWFGINWIVNESDERKTWTCRKGWMNVKKDGRGGRNVKP